MGHISRYVRRSLRRLSTRRPSLASGAFPQPRGELAAVQRTRAGAGRGSGRPAARTRPVPGDLLKQPRRVLPGTGRGTETADGDGPAPADDERPEATRGADQD